jgi:hypothetical protein
MRTAMIIMRYPCGEETLHMVDRQRDNTVQTFPPQRADEPLTERISLRTLGWRFEDLESQVLYTLIELA